MKCGVCYVMDNKSLPGVHSSAIVDGNAQCTRDCGLHCVFSDSKQLFTIAGLATPGNNDSLFWTNIKMAFNTNRTNCFQTSVTSIPDVILTSVGYIPWASLAWLDHTALAGGLLYLSNSPITLTPVGPQATTDSYITPHASPPCSRSTWKMVYWWSTQSSWAI